MASKTKKKYTYSTKAVLMPDGTRKYIRAKTREELDEKVLQAQILVKSGVDICSEETFGHFAQMWFDIYKKPYLREKTKMQLNMCLITRIAPAWRLSSPRYQPMQIQALMAGLSGKSNSLQSKVLIHLHSIFTVAIEVLLGLQLAGLDQHVAQGHRLHAQGPAHCHALPVAVSAICGVMPSM